MNYKSVQKNAGKSYVLTPNKRLARHLEKKLGCSREIIVSIDSWLMDCWKQVGSPLTLLIPYQEKIIWQQIVHKHMERNNSLPIVEAAIDFHRLINEYAIDLNDFDETYDEISKFLTLYKIFISHCKKNQLITLSEISKLLGPYLEELNLAKITLVAFNEQTPSIRMLLDDFKNRGSEIIFSDNYQGHSAVIARSEHSIERVASDVAIHVFKNRYIGFNTLEEEIRTAALWAYSHKSKKIGIIVPNLVTLREKIATIFDEVFENDRRVINISIGSRLDTLPIIKSALLLLSLSAHPSDEEIKEMILSPYINGFLENAGIGSNAGEQSRSAVIARSERSAEHEVRSTKRVTRQSMFLKAESPRLTKNVSLAMTAVGARNNGSYRQEKKLPPSEWKSLFIETLKIFGWPGDKKLSALESKTVTLFYNILEELSSNDAIIGSILHEQAIQLLKAIVGSNTVQLPDEEEATINILGALEGVGIDFDQLWIMGLDENSWPGAAKPNPLIPMALQKKLDLPHSSPTREWEFCKNLLARYGKGAKNIVFSYVKQQGEREILPSRMIVDNPLITIDQLNLPTIISPTQRIFSERVPSPKGIPSCVKRTPLVIISGGNPPLWRHPFRIEGAVTSRAIETQSLCPFKAFVEFRLMPGTNQPKTLGISKPNRGIIIHYTLDFFWKEIKNQNNLLQLTESDTRKLISEGISSALRQLAIAEPLGRLERLSLIDLLNSWLNLEKKRESFQVLEAEKQYTIDLNGITINLRVDRIDQLADGRILLIDYKSGKHLPSVFGWFSTRPTHLQLPLYSLALDRIDGLAMAQINHGAMKFREITLKELTAAIHQLRHCEERAQCGARSAKYETSDVAIHSFAFTDEISWQLVSNYWRTILTKLAEDFIAGKSDIDPLSQEVCANCNFSAICRVK